MRDDKDEYFLIHRHYRKILEHPQFKRSRLVFIPENDLGMEHHHLSTMVKELPNVQVFWETPKKPGINKTNPVTGEYRFLLMNCLMQSAIKFDRDLMTISREQTPQSMLNLAQAQMLQYHWSVKKSEIPGVKDRVKLTGKVGNAQDDLLIAMMMVMYWGRLITRDVRRLEVHGG